MKGAEGYRGVQRGCRGVYNRGSDERKVDNIMAINNDMNNRFRSKSWLRFFLWVLLVIVILLAVASMFGYKFHYVSP